MTAGKVGNYAQFGSPMVDDQGLFASKKDFVIALKPNAEDVGENFDCGITVKRDAKIVGI